MHIRVVIAALLLAIVSISRTDAQTAKGIAVSYSERSQGEPIVQLYPNPAPEYLNVRLESMNLKDVRVSLHSIIGNEMSVEKEITEDNEIRLKVKDLVSGYYFLTIRNEETNFRGTYRFLKV